MLVRIILRVGFRLHCLVGNPLFEPEFLADGHGFRRILRRICVLFVCNLRIR